MNMKRLEYIREVVVNIIPETFDMLNYEHACGSPSCILGQAFAKLCTNKAKYTKDAGNCKGTISYLRWSEEYLNLNPEHKKDRDIWDYLFSAYNSDSIGDALDRIDIILEEGYTNINQLREVY